MDEIRSILVHLDASSGAMKRLRVAHRLAATHGAELDVLYAVTPALLQYPLTTSTADGQLGALLAAMDAQTCARVRADFERERADIGLTNLAWQQANDLPQFSFVPRAFEADLLVLAKPATDESQGAQVPNDFAPSVLIESGKPALVLPSVEAGAEFGRTILVAWKGAAASARAVTAALPMLRLAHSVHVVSWDEPGGTAANHPLPVERFLSRHAVSAKVHRCGRPKGDVGELMLSMAAEVDADMLVMGCYGHSRAREWWLGGATRTILSAMTLPVLMSH